LRADGATSSNGSAAIGVKNYAGIIDWLEANRAEEGFASKPPAVSRVAKKPDRLVETNWRRRGSSF
jgi:hypothetical protein